METITYQPRGVCSRHMEIDVDNGIIQAVRVQGGCSGNLQGICSLLKGMKVEDAIAHYDNVVIMKAGGSIGRILELMKQYDRAENCATVISCVGMKDEYIGPLDPERTYSYFTTVIIKKEKR